ncbi:MAG: hypothetical protein COV07_03365 [Candidatus Vogelbacteria bacterium CG10_big_fil_rev_8_21_14_0_10_45_14]|uniref:Phosphomannomutase/phosphoglucomutase n=1 Tax=Candidatus Vogelbacteria bacterium CG10_big_fil_rev_8_21_14_0_10_45_14 TaxID=1975042 RepID=A0A2H0RJD0_9BACT|nr:MAG: hypothetical protein COV07_03365 [Candidatus Vogelbacteria bacterium CG10_big_fil_rev_8_21_14_0_10_45_14]
MISPQSFKSYDIRGLVPDELDREGARALGFALARKEGAKTAIVGRDMRSTSKELAAGLISGLSSGGAEVVDVGLVSTPELYFIAGKEKCDVAVMITASHNPSIYNGMKICRKGTMPIGGASGLYEIRDRIASQNLPAEKDNYTPRLVEHESEYAYKLTSRAKLSGKKYRVAVDVANAMGIRELMVLGKIPELSLIPLFDTYDPSFPNHPANPLDHSTLVALQDKVRETEANIGLAYDGDADRIGFVDERGEIVTADVITTIVACALLREERSALVLHDLRLSRFVSEYIEKAGGRSKECVVGHANIKSEMRESDAIFAGELSCHYYYRDMYFAESPTLTAILVLNEMARSGKALSELCKAAQKYCQSGELNFQVQDTGSLISLLLQKYSSGKISQMDGIKIVYPSWWFSVRASNTEPLVRLNLEADTKEELTLHLAELQTIINSHTHYLK